MYKVSLDRFLGYTYENMQNDLGIFARIFPETIQIDSMGRTEDNRELYHFRIGSANGTKKSSDFWWNTRTGIYDQPAAYGADHRISHEIVQNPVQRI